MIQKAFITLLLLTSLFASAQDQANTTTRLISEAKTIAPGEPFWVGIEMAMAEDWHTYYLNAGESGYATTADWTLPDGFTAGPIVWAVPHKKIMDDMITYEYAGTIMHLVEITPAKDLKEGTTLELSADIAWLECKVLCLPGDASLTITSTVAATARKDPAVQKLFADARAHIAVNTDAWKSELTVDDSKLTLRLTGLPDPGEATFIFDSGTDDVEKNQTWKKDGESYELSLDFASQEMPATLRGMLVNKKGWGALIDLPIGAASAKGTAPVVEFEKPTTEPKTSREATEEELAALEVMHSWGSEKPKRGLFLILIFAVIGGIILNIMPCVFPVLGIKIMGFVQQAGSDKKQIRLHGLVFGAGVLVSMWVLAGILVATSAAWGSMFQEAGFLAFMIALLFALGLNMAGLFEIGTSLTGVGGNMQHQKGLLGSFSTGILTVMIATPCTGPYMGPALGFAATQPAFVAMLIFTFLGIGIALPYVLLSYFPALIDKLPPPGQWMVTFKQTMAFPLIGTAIWLLSVYSKSKGATGVIWLLWGLLAIGLACWLYGRYSESTKTRSRLLAYASTAGLIAIAVYTAMQSTKGKAPEVVKDFGIPIVDFLPTKVVELRAQGKTLFIDFTADW